jgi:hypothetical protein
MVRSRALPSRIGLILLGIALLPAPARGLEATVFISGASPEVLWNRGYGATVGFGFLKLAAFEVEVAKQPGAIVDNGMISLTGAALFAPSFGPFVPFIGIGAGFQREETAVTSDYGTHSAFIVGGKIKLAGILVLRAEWRRLGLAGTPLLQFDDRFAGGIGLSF